VLVRLGNLLLIIALLGATGGHWAFLQTIAWTNMLAGNLNAATIGEAITKTFDGEHPCRLCKEISSGKKEEQRSELPFQIKKLEFVITSPGLVLQPAFEFPRIADRASAYPSQSRVPPVPPPRLALT